MAVTTSEPPVFEHPPWVYVFVDGRTSTSPGLIRIRERDGRPGSVILAQRGREVAMVEVFRSPLGRTLLELPRGFNEDGESPREGAVREFNEETGHRLLPDDLVRLGEVAPNSGILESIVELFYARVPVGDSQLQPADPEVGRARWIALSDVRSMVADGAIFDGFTLAALYRAELRGLISIER